MFPNQCIEAEGAAPGSAPWMPVFAQLAQAALAVREPVVVEGGRRVEWQASRGGRNSEKEC